MVQEFCQSRRATCTVKYQGSLDIALALKAGNDPEADAVWPAASIWIDMFDTARRVKSVKSIAQMPVILGVRRSKAQALGWIGAKVTTKDILAAVRRRPAQIPDDVRHPIEFRRRRLSRHAGGRDRQAGPDRSRRSRQDARCSRPVRGLLRGVERSSGSSGWLADLYREGERTGAHYEAMWNYEAVIKETNDKLVADRKEPLYAIYPEDGVSVGDSPLGFVDRGRGKEVESFFADLQGFLLKSETQARIAATGRRVELGRAGSAQGRRRHQFRPEPPAHGCAAAGACRDSEGAGALSGSTAAAVADRAVSRRVRQHAGRTAKQQLLEAMRFLLTPARTREVLVQWSKQDRIIVLPFSDRVLWTATGSGDDG